MKKISLELTGKLVDGTVIVIDGEYSVGSEVYVIDETGAKAPIFNGDHELASGDVFVTVDGKITEIKPKEEQATEEVTTETLNETQLSITKEEFNALLEAFNNFKAEFSMEMINAMIETKINGITKVEEPKVEETTLSVVEPKDYKSFVLSRIEALNS